MDARVLEPERIVRLEPDAVVLLDQRCLPDEEVELRCESVEALVEAIRGLAIRGAPAIGIAAGYGLALAASHGEDLDAAYDSLLASRPTAVNLRWALGELRSDPTPERARSLHEEEVKRCREMSRHAAHLLDPRSRVLTHCNTGALATGGHGSALGAIRTGWEQGLVEHVWVDETRPVLQGARLTAWELETLGIPFAVIADGAAASLMRAGEVDAVLVGADRIALNGDVANKVGTYGLAIAARRHAVPFVVVAPSSSVDLATSSGDGIPIEKRPDSELSTRFPAFNPAFDVTPAELVTAIVTERGVHRTPYEESLPGMVGSTR